MPIVLLIVYYCQLDPSFSQFGASPVFKLIVALGLFKLVTYNKGHLTKKNRLDGHSTEDTVQCTGAGTRMRTRTLQLTISTL